MRSAKAPLAACVRIRSMKLLCPLITSQFKLELGGLQQLEPKPSPLKRDPATLPGIRSQPVESLTNLKFRYPVERFKYAERRKQGILTHLS